MLALLVWGTTADAENCGARDSMVAILADRYGELAQMSAVNSDGTLIEFLASKDSGTWTLLASDGGGNACVLDMGVGWEILKQGATL
jgi:hypothetical protein